MHNAEAAIEPAFYDHEDDSVQARDRVAADWGADEVFAAVPRRRFRGERHPVVPASSRRSSLHHPDLIRPDAPPAGVHAPVASDPEPAPAELTHGVDFAAPQAWTEAPGEPAGRRTVTITGRPEGAPPKPRPAVADRRRRPKSVEEHIGGRPDRVAGWAFGMGLLLIAVAALS